MLLSIREGGVREPRRGHHRSGRDLLQVRQLVGDRGWPRNGSFDKYHLLTVTMYCSSQGYLQLRHYEIKQIYYFADIA